MSSRRAIFLDRDGVINVNRQDHVKSVSEFVFLPHVLGALRRMAALDFVVVVTTNQAAINRRLVSESTVRDIHTHMLAEIARAGGCIDAVYYCPHTPEENCDCRKPRPGMNFQAARDFDLDLGRSYVIGDARVDVEAANSIGACALLVLSGRGCDRHKASIGYECADCGTGCVVVETLMSAVEWIGAKEDSGL